MNNNTGHTAPDMNVIRYLLDVGQDTLPGQRYRDPKIETRDDVRRPYFHIRPYVPMIGADGIERRQRSFNLDSVMR